MTADIDDIQPETPEGQFLDIDNSKYEQSKDDLKPKEQVLTEAEKQLSDIQKEKNLLPRDFNTGGYCDADKGRELEDKEQEQMEKVDKLTKEKERQEERIADWEQELQEEKQEIDELSNEEQESDPEKEKEEEEKNQKQIKQDAERIQAQAKERKNSVEIGKREPPKPPLSHTDNGYICENSKGQEFVLATAKRNHFNAISNNLSTAVTGNEDHYVHGHRRVLVDGSEYYAVGDTRYVEIGKGGQAIKVNGNEIEDYRQNLYTQIVGLEERIVQQTQTIEVALKALHDYKNDLEQLISKNYIRTVGKNEKVKITGRKVGVVHGNSISKIDNRELKIVDKSSSHKYKENLKQKIMENYTQEVMENFDQTVKGNFDQTVKGNFDQKVTGNFDQKVTGNYNVVIDGSYDVHYKKNWISYNRGMKVDIYMGAKSSITAMTANYTKFCMNHTGITIEDKSHKVTWSELVSDLSVLLTKW